jgi:hypothetical protein
MRGPSIEVWKDVPDRPSSVKGAVMSGSGSTNRMPVGSSPESASAMPSAAESTPLVSPPTPAPPAEGT